LQWNYLVCWQQENVHKNKKEKPSRNIEFTILRKLDIGRHDEINNFANYQWRIHEMQIIFQEFIKHWSKTRILKLNRKRSGKDIPKKWIFQGRSIRVSLAKKCFKSFFLLWYISWLRSRYELYCWLAFTTLFINIGLLALCWSYWGMWT
jgi:hypothetical protein